MTARQIIARLESALAPISIIEWVKSQGKADVLSAALDKNRFDAFHAFCKVDAVPCGRHQFANSVAVIIRPERDGDSDDPNALNYYDWLRHGGSGRLPANSVLTFYIPAAKERPLVFLDWVRIHAARQRRDQYERFETAIRARDASYDALYADYSGGKAYISYDGQTAEEVTDVTQARLRHKQAQAETNAIAIEFSQTVMFA